MMKLMRKVHRRLKRTFVSIDERLEWPFSVEYFTSEDIVAVEETQNQAERHTEKKVSHFCHTQSVSLPFVGLFLIQFYSHPDVF